MSLVGVWALPQDHELLFEIAVDERKESDGREEDVRHERVYDFREALGDAALSNRIQSQGFATGKDKKTHIRPTATWRTLSLATKSGMIASINILCQCTIN